MTQRPSALSELMLVRPGNNEDTNFIYATWLRGLRWGNELFKIIDQEAYFDKYKQVIEIIIKRPNTRINVAALKEDPNVVLGYSVIEDNKLHWVFVKKAWRNMGVATSLVPKTVSICTHMTNSGYKILERKPLIFNPFL